MFENLPPPHLFKIVYILNCGLSDFRCLSSPPKVYHSSSFRFPNVLFIIQVCEMLHLSVSTFRHGALISSHISKWWPLAANKMGSQLWFYISLSRYIIQVCKMLHLFVSTFRHGALISSYISKWWLVAAKKKASQP